MNQPGWRLSEWNAVYQDSNLPPMTNEEIQDATRYLRDNYYPKPTDCPGRDCPKFRPACQLNICQIAVSMCGDF